MSSTDPSVFASARELPLDALPIEPRSFTRGMGAGLACALVLVHVWLAMMLADLRMAYDDFGGHTSVFTQLTPSAPWLWGVSVTGAAATVLVIQRRPRAIWPYAALVVGLTATVVATWYWSQQPLRELADKIR